MSTRDIDRSPRSSQEFSYATNEPSNDKENSARSGGSRFRRNPFGEFKPGRYGFFHLRRFTLLPEAELQHRPQERHFLIRQPRHLQYYIDGRYVDASGRELGPHDSVKNLLESIRDEDTNKSVRTLHKEGQPSDGSLLMRNRLDLIIDLVWVGITVNISKTFELSAFDQETGYRDSVLLFLVIFLLSFRIWDQLRSFLNNFFNGDAFQAIFILWMLVLGLAFGNNALEPVKNRLLDFLVWIYLAARASLWFIEMIYGTLIPALRPQLYVTVILSIPSTILLIGSVFGEWPVKPLLILGAMLLEIFIPILMQSSFITGTLLHKKLQMAIDAEHYTERLESFFLLMIGEGILLLIKDGALAFGVTSRFGTGALTLVCLFLLAILYFNGDMSKRYIHGVKRNKYSGHLYLCLHVVLYAALLIFDAGISYLVKYNEEGQASKPKEERAMLNQDPKYPLQHAARWMVSISLSIIVLAITFLALLHKPMPDPPGSSRMLVPNRYLRLLPRLLFIIAVSCLPLVESMHSTMYLGIISILLDAVAVWEYIVCLERVDGRIQWFEPQEDFRHEDGHPSDPA